MIGGGYVVRMARYNRWQNQNCYGAADRLSDDERRRERGAFWGSIHETLNHLLWGDQMWMSRLTGSGRPPVAIAESGSLHPDWTALKAERSRFDRTILDWADTIEPAWLAADMTYYSFAAQREVTQPHWVLVTPPGPSSRPGPLHAHPGRRATGRYRPAVHAGVRRDVRHDPA
jgi:uncharacterized damage-inducible protein DinB